MPESVVGSTVAPQKIDELALPLEVIRLVGVSGGASSLSTELRPMIALAFSRIGFATQNSARRFQSTGIVRGSGT